MVRQLGVEDNILENIALEERNIVTKIMLKDQESNCKGKIRVAVYNL